MNYKINIGEDVFELNEAEVASLNLISLKNGEIHVLQDDQAFWVSNVQTNYQTKVLTIEVNGNKYELKIEDEYDQLVKKMGLSSGGAKKIKTIKAPMPGLILEVLIEVGQPVEKGTPLLVLEAMKMENVLKAEGEGVVKSVEVKKGEAVDKGQVIIEME